MKVKVSLLQLEIVVLDGIVVEVLSQPHPPQMEHYVQLALTAPRVHHHQICVIQECTAIWKDWPYQQISVLQDTFAH